MADKSIHELPAAITMTNNDVLVLEQDGIAKKLSGSTLGNYVYAAAGNKILEVEAAVEESQEAVQELTNEKNIIVRSIESMAAYGTDTTLTTAGMGADAKRTGEVVKASDGSRAKALGAFVLGDVPDGTVIFNANDVAVGDTIYYDISAYDGYTGMISFYDATDNRIWYGGKMSSSSEQNDYSGIITIPSDFSYAKAGAGRGSATYYVKINWLSTRFKTFIVAEGINSTEKVDWTRNLLDPTKVKTGYGLLYSNGLEVARSGIGITDYIPVFPGCKYSKNWNLGSDTYGTFFYAADKKTVVGKITENTYVGDIIVPEGAHYLRTNVSTSYISQIRIYVTPPQFNNVNDIDNYEVTKAGELVGGYTYSAFPVMAQFNGGEVIAFRSAYEHYTRYNDYCGTAFYFRDSQGKVTFKKFIRDDDPAFEGSYAGEFRVGAISVTPDGQRLFVSGFFNTVSHNETGAVYGNLIYELDSTFEIVGYSIINQQSNYVAIGKTLVTPQGYLIIPGHSLNQGRVVLFKSDTVYNNNISEMTFSNISTITTGTQVSECDIGYTDDKLVCVIRRHTDNSLIVWTSNKEGGGWGTPQELGSPIHMPRILRYTSGNYIVYGGARYYTDRLRYPIVGVYDLENQRVIQESVFWSEYDSYGGYLDFAKYDGEHYDFVFYSDYLARNSYLSQIIYKRINIREFCPAVNLYI